MKRLTLRLNDKSYQKLYKYKYMNKLRNHKISYNKLINIIILNKLHNINISNDDISKIKHIHNSNEYITFSKKLANLTNSINNFIYKIKGTTNNINQISKNINILSKNNRNNEIPYSLQNLCKYQQALMNCLIYCDNINRGVSKIWKEM